MNETDVVFIKANSTNDYQRSYPWVFPCTIYLEQYKIGMLVIITSLLVLLIVRQWNELDCILRLEGSDCLYECCQLSSELDPKAKQLSPWTDAWQLYEDVCLVCADFWIGSWRGNSSASYSTGNGPITDWGKIRLDGDDDLSLGGAYMRNLGTGIEGGPVQMVRTLRACGNQPECL